MAFAEGRVPLTKVGDESGQHLDKSLLQVCSLREQTPPPHGTGSPSCWKGENGHLRSPLGGLDRER